MINLLKDKMSTDNYNLFLLEYNALYYDKQKMMYKETIKNNKNNVFLKRFFNDLPDKYNYFEFSKNICNNNSIKEKIQIEINTHGLNKAACLLTHYTIEIYIAFLIEYVIKQEIENRSNIKVIYNDNLDVYKKCDLYIDNTYFQIKNYSFIESNYFIDDLLSKYKSINKDLQFIFYTIEQDNIYFMEFNNTIIHSIDSINAFSVFQKPERRNIYYLLDNILNRKELKA